MKKWVSIWFQRLLQNRKMCGGLMLWWWLFCSEPGFRWRSDGRYLELRGKPVGTVWAPNEQSPIINILAWSNMDKSFLTLLSKRFQTEGEMQVLLFPPPRSLLIFLIGSGFQVVMGQKPNYFHLGGRDERAALLFLVVSWKAIHFGGAFGRLVETVEDIAGHVETIAMSATK